MSRDQIRVLLADDHAVVRAGLKAVLGGARDIEVVGEAKTGREAVALAERLKPDIVIMDLSMPDLDGTAATKEIAEKGLPTKVLVLTMHAEEDYLVPLMEAGAAGYLMKNAADRALIDAIRAVARGDVYVGERLFISPKTVDTYKQRITEKLGLAHRSEYVQFALKLGLLTQAP